MSSTQSAPHIMAVINEKGGVGKSALVAHLAMFAAEHRGLKVLVIDTDSAGGQSDLFGVKSEDVGASGLFAAGVAVTPLACRPNIDLIPADDAMVDVDRVGLQAGNGKNMPKEAVVFSEQIRVVSKGYDLVLIDTPGALQDRVFCVMCAASSIFTPFAIEAQTERYLGRVGAAYQNVRDSFNPELKHIGLVPSMIDCRNGDERRAIAALREQAGAFMLDGGVCRRAHIKLSMRAGHAVWKRTRTESDRHAASEMKAICETLLKRAGL
jgi:chromosome partitioning protein